MPRPVLRRSRALHARRVASRRGEVYVQIRRTRIGELPLDGALELDALDKLEADHHGVAVECAHRERALAQLLRHGVKLVESLLPLAHKVAKRIR